MALAVLAPSPRPRSVAAALVLLLGALFLGLVPVSSPTGTGKDASPPLSPGFYRWTQLEVAQDKQEAFLEAVKPLIKSTALVKCGIMRNAKWPNTFNIIEICSASIACSDRKKLLQYA